MFFILHNIPCSPIRSSEKIGYKVGKSPLFLAFHVSCFVYFQVQNLHFAPFYLSSLGTTHNFSSPNNPLLALKTLLFNGYFAPFSHVFDGSKRFCLYHSSVFLCFLSRIQQHFTLHFASKRTVFSGILHRVLHQNALHFAANRPKTGVNDGLFK